MELPIGTAQTGAIRRMTLVVTVLALSAVASPNTVTTIRQATASRILFFSEEMRR